MAGSDKAQQEEGLKETKKLKDWERQGQREPGSEKVPRSLHPKAIFLLKP